MGHKKHYKLEMDFVCDQKWELMPDAGPGKFCNQCSKTLIDFTNLTDSEIFEYLKKPHVCGRISEAQLNRPLNLPFEHQITWWKKMAMGLGLLSMWGGQLLAFNRKSAPRMRLEKKFNSDDMSANKFPIKGKVSLENVTVDCSKIKINLDGTDIVGYTDSLGNFELMIPDTLELEPLKFNFHRADLMPLEYHLKQINKSDFIAVKMDERVPVLLGKPISPKDEKRVIHPIQYADLRVNISKDGKLISGIRIDIYTDDTLVDQLYSDSNGHCIFDIQCYNQSRTVIIKAISDDKLVYTLHRSIQPGLNQIVEIDLTQPRPRAGYVGISVIRRAEPIDMNSNIQTIKNPIKNPVIRE